MIPTGYQRKKKINEKSMEVFMLGKAHSLRLYPTQKKKFPKMKHFFHKNPL
jgi:hypothetical protein